jgi:glutamyl-tRNA synthetase
MSLEAPAVVTRFAPSPTGFLHIGGARTALFNWLYARRHGGQFRLRIEDTDRVRSTREAIDAILDGLQWLGLDWDGDAVFQFSLRERHARVARELLAAGKAYLCFCSAEELEAMREKARSEGSPARYDGRWRDRDPAEAPPGVKPVIRFKSPNGGDTVIHDQVQGDVTFANDQLDDMVLLRSDGTPTYMLSVVVDDHDMGVTHVIRGDDHLTNGARQSQLYDALGWEKPIFAHIPLIHGADGHKLSKRHGALGVDAYRDMGYLPEAVRNYLLRLGWGHGDDEIIATEQAIKWFNLEGIGRSASRFDFVKLESLNAHYIREAQDSRLTPLVAPLIDKQLGRPLTPKETARLEAAMPGLKMRAKTLNELAASALFYFIPRPLALNEAAEKILTPEGREMLGRLLPAIEVVSGWTPEELEVVVAAFADVEGVKLGKVAQPLRAALTGSNISPGIFEVLHLLGREDSIARIRDQVI